MQENLEQLKPFCISEPQSALINALIAAQGNRRVASEMIGITERSIYSMLGRIKRQAAAKGYAPEHDMTKTSAPGFIVKGVSTLYDSEGELKSQWVKTTSDGEKFELLQDEIKNVFSEWKGKGKIYAAPKIQNSELLTVYPMGDPHLGMFAWGEESGEDFDLKIGEQNLTSAVDRLVSCSPKSESALILNLGDFFHADTMDNKTRRSGVPLDVDSRWSKLLRVGVRTMIRCIEAATAKHQKVTVVNMIGNHDDHTSQMLSIALSLFYEGNDRVTVDCSPAKFWYLKFGSVLIGSTHGDTCKVSDLPGIMATDRAEDWGETKHRYFYTGHIHNRNVGEYPGLTWESFRTLAAKDSWHAGKGYRSGRDMYCIVLSKEGGEIERHRVDISML